VGDPGGDRRTGRVRSETPVEPCATLTGLSLPVLAANGGIRSTESFFRYFLAPGVMHCGTPGPGSIAPTNPMQQVINWVENGQAPAVLDASGSVNGQSVTRPLCPYPDPDAIYTGGDPNVASSYACRSEPQYTNPFLLNGQH
jgi:hypothetical protein